MTKRIAMAISWLVVLGPVAVRAEDTSNEQVSQDIRKMEEQWVSAAKQKDVKPLDSMLADDYTMTNPVGEVIGKEDFISKIKDGTFHINSAEYKDIKVRVYGDAAVVTGRVTLQATWSGTDVGGTFALTDTFVKRDGKWQEVAGQVTRVEGQ